MLSARRRWVVIALLAWAPGCQGRPEPTPTTRPASRPLGSPIAFSWVATTGALFSSQTTRGRVTAVLFGATYDLPTQAEAKYLSDVIQHHKPRANAGMVVLEAEEHLPLVEAYRGSLGLVYPVCLADPITRFGEGPFGRIDRIPTLIVLDREGRVFWRKSGLVSPEQIEEALAMASGGDPGDG